jgi:hypothetical protein
MGRYITFGIVIGAALIQRLAHHLQHIPREFRKFVQEQHTVVRKRNFAGPGHHASADKPGVGNRMMSLAEWPHAH